MIEHDDVYDILTADNGNTQWAFGTDFDDPLAGVDTSVPDDIDGGLLAQYCLMLGDDALISAQRLIEWVTRAPELEQELGMANMALDLLGQARLLFARAAAADPTVVPDLSPTSPAPPDDRLAFFRSQEEFRCVRLCELDNGDFAHTILRMLIFSTWRLGLFQRLTESRDPFLAAVSHSWCKELAYHRDYAARWTVILAGGSPESRRRTTDALNFLWPYTGELWATTAEELTLADKGVAVDARTIAADFHETITHVIRAAELTPPQGISTGTLAGRAGRDGVHTEALGRLLTELQCVARANPEGRW